MPRLLPRSGTAFLSRSLSFPAVLISVSTKVLLQRNPLAGISNEPTLLAKKSRIVWMINMDDKNINKHFMFLNNDRSHFSTGNTATLLHTFVI
jgi:hypothetical protein